MSKRRKKVPNDLKIIAIKPIEGCIKEYLKVLKVDQIYLLYNDFQIDPKTDAIEYEATIPAKLFDQNELSINVSAIAGQNGSGKSSLIELLFMAINNISVSSVQNPELAIVKGIAVEVYCQIGAFYKIRVHDNKVEVFEYNADLTLNQTPIDFDIQQFFYTIAINYSLYAYNSTEVVKEQDDWLGGLFHKNDSYQTPLVINPWRDKGNIEINNENALVRLRLMANILRPDEGLGFNFRKTTDNLTAIKLQLTANKLKSKHILYYFPEQVRRGEKQMEVTLKDLKEIDKHEILKRLNKLYSFKYKKPVNDREIEATDYLIGKLVTIAMTYSEYKDLSYYSHEQQNFNMELLDDFLGRILEDPSHIAFKVKQTLNFLRHPYIEFKTQQIDIANLSAEIANIRKNSRRKYRIEELIPPPIFNVDILLAKDTEILNQETELIPFRTLSSGERQLIYSISSIIYHLINLDSVKRYNKKIKYERVNIVLEEVELYFHPEMQRGFVKKLLDSIKNIELETIKGINLCFITHSPFILSDIPDANVMFLKVVDKVSQLANRNEKTFGANIHDLLADGFFMYSGLSGEFATQKINETIAFLDYSKRYKAYLLARADFDKKSKQMVGETSIDGLQVSLKTLDREEAELAEVYTRLPEKKKEEHYKLINAIGESVLSIKLLEMYDEIFAISRRQILEEKLKSIQAELENLNKN